MNWQRRQWLWWVAAFVGWTALALLVIGEEVTAARMRGRDLADWREVLVWRLADWYEVGIFLPIVFIAVRRWPLERGHLSTRAPLHAMVCVGPVLVRHLVFPLLRARLGYTPSVPVSPMAALAGNLITDALAFCILDALLHGAEYYRRFREREITALQLQARLSDARLHAMRAQLNPHFLFNTLNAATTLLHRDPIAADRMLTGLGELLRHTLQPRVSHETPLRDELLVLEDYLEIMRARFGPRVTIHQSIAPEALELMVPSLVLQPLVENAFDHGIARRSGPGNLWIDARVDGGALTLTVEDDGPGPPDDWDARAGLGIDITAGRLRELYGSAGTVTLTRRELGGAAARVRLPVRTAQEADA